MFGMGWAELMIVGIVALIVVGPKELPILFRKMGQFVGKAKGMAREFSRAMNDAADQAGVGDIQKTLNAATNPVNTALQGVKDATTSFTKLDLDPESETGKLAAERAENARKIQAATARKVAERKAREAEEALKKAEEIEAEAEKLAAEALAAKAEEKSEDKA
jgi:sec-independent protein translocase protein TatB